MNFMRNHGKTLQKAVLISLVGGLSVGVAIAQHKNTSSAPKSAPSPHVSAPRPSVSRPSTSRPSTTPHSSTMGGRSGNSTGIGHGNAGTRTGTTLGKTGGRTGTSAMGTHTTGRTTGTGTVSRNGNGRGSMGRTGTGMGKGTTGTVGRGVNRPLPGRQVSLRGGGTASLRPNGQIRSINRNGMQINHGLNGSRHIESTRNGAHIVTTGKHSGYVQRPYVTRNGRTYVSRTVVVNNVTYTNVYRSYSYGGYCCYYGYHPAFYYAPVYYGWAYNPWPAPVYYGWGWGGAPWYGYYGGYFAPYPTYPSAAFWLTDYLIAANLQAAYQAQAAANANADANANGNSNNAPQDQQQSQGNGNADTSASNSGTVTLSPEVKAAIAEEVKAQLATEQAAAQGSSSGSGTQGSATGSASTEDVPPALDPAKRTFVVASDLTVASDGQECQLSQGDVITRTSETPDQDRKVTATVAASKKTDCGIGKEIAVSVDDLQEMYNHFQEQLDNGMKDLSSKQGKSGIPAAPDTKTVSSDVPPPPPDASAAKALQDQQATADQMEAQVVKEAFSQGS